MAIDIVLQFLVVALAIWIGARTGGIGLGLWGAVGLLVLSACFGVVPTAPPVDVLLIVLAVVTAASVLEAAGGTEVLVGVAERVIRAHPQQVTLVAPLTTWCFTFVAGTGHVVYPLLPVIYETAHRNGIRPERPMAVAAIASQQAITASPVSAATAAMIALFAEHDLAGWGRRRWSRWSSAATSTTIPTIRPASARGSSLPPTAARIAPRRPPRGAARWGSSSPRWGSS